MDAMMLGRALAMGKRRCEERLERGLGNACAFDEADRGVTIVNPFRGDAEGMEYQICFVISRMVSTM